MPRTRSRIHEVCGVKVLLYGSNEFRGVLKTLVEKGENVHGKQYIILAKEPISLEKRAEVKAWYDEFINDLANKAQSPKKSVSRRAKKLLKEIGFIITRTP